MPRRLSIAAKFFLTHLAVAGAALFVAGTVGFLFVRGFVQADADDALTAEARLMAETFRPLLATMPLPFERIAEEGDLLGRISGTRITIVLPDGTVVADSTVGAARVGTMENHASHAEIREALSGTPGHSQRRSITIHEEMRYVALPIVQDGVVIGVARAAVPAAVLNRRLWEITGVIWGTGLAALLLILAGAGYLARRITVPLAEMREAAREIGSGNLTRTLQIRTGDELEAMAEAMNRMASQLAGTIDQLEAAKTRLMTLLANLSDGVIVITPARTVRMMNLAAGKILEVSETMGEGRPYAEVIRIPQVLSFVDGWVGGGSPRPREISLPGREGNRTVRIAGATVRHPGETGADVLLTLRDVTEERRLSQIKSDFVSNASHELRTPLTTVRGYLEAMLDTVREGGAPDPAFLKTAHGSALRMERLIDDLLELSRAESETSSTQRDEIPIGPFLSRVADLHRHASERAGKTVVVSAGAGTFRADLRMLTLGLSNLLDNAIKYGKEGGRITLSGKIEGDDCVLEVVDDGPGIPPEHLPRIFERFYRVDKGRSRELGGTGLGLSIARHVAEAHRGTIRVESRLGVGTRFTVRIPGAPA